MIFVLQKYHLKLVFREISHLCKIKESEFLDVNHIINGGEKGGIYVRNYINGISIGFTSMEDHIILAQFSRSSTINMIISCTF